jgi:hypothetical protein
MEATQEQETRSFRVRKHVDMGARKSTDPVVIYTMALLEAEADRFGQEQRKRLEADPTLKLDVIHAINVHIALADALLNLSREQCRRMDEVCREAVGLVRRPRR